MDIPCGGGCGVRSNVVSLFLSLGAKFTFSVSCCCGCCWRDKLGKAGAFICVDFFCLDWIVGSETVWIGSNRIEDYIEFDSV